MKNGQDNAKNVEENEYQVALDNVKALAEEQVYYMGLSDVNLNKDIKLLQELANKEVPKKPIKPLEGSTKDWVSAGLCPNCESEHIYDYEYDRKFKRCADCGQKLDQNLELSKNE